MPSDFARRIRRSNRHAGRLDNVHFTTANPHASSASAPARSPTIQPRRPQSRARCCGHVAGRLMGAICGDSRQQCLGFWVDRALRFRMRQARHLRRNHPTFVTHFDREHERPLMVHGAGAICGDSRQQRLPASGQRPLSYAAGQHLRRNHPYLRASLRSRARASSRVHGRYRSDDCVLRHQKILCFGMAGSPAPARATFVGSLNAVHMTAGQQALADQVPVTNSHSRMQW